MDLYKLFNDFIKIGFKVRSSKLNGLEEWRDKSTSLNDTEKIGEWKTSRKIVESEHEINTLNDNYNYVHDNLNMKGEDDDNKTDKNLWDQYHFFLQLIRIPKKSLCTTKKIAQIGYNIGQFMASFGCGNYSEQVINYFHLNELDNLDSYVDFSEASSSEENSSASSSANSSANSLANSSASSLVSSAMGGGHNSLFNGTINPKKGIEYNLNIYNKFLSMTPSKKQIFPNNICVNCKSSENKCSTCGSEYINLV